MLLYTLCAAVCCVVCPHSVKGQRSVCTRLCDVWVVVSWGGLGGMMRNELCDFTMETFCTNSLEEELLFSSLAAGELLWDYKDISVLFVCSFKNLKMMHLPHYSAIIANSQSQQIGHCCPLCGVKWSRPAASPYSWNSVAYFSPQMFGKTGFSCPSSCNKK